ncbi:protein phosphatase 2C domain-containing protein [Massilia sp. 2TAF26]|uniref:protein phosphatase 2C domain-containing protein n=1 Tax=Massilia sp. 2TAF26 TaxID=3233012 RepID=UPI003F9500D1
MRWTSVSSAADGHGNEDHVAVFERDEVTDIVVLDGASSVAQQDYIDSENGDVAWFVRRFGAAFGRALTGSGSQEQVVRAALDEVRAEFHARTDGVAVPVYAWPIAAMTWIRIMPGRGASELILYCLGDCKTLLLRPDGGVQDLDPYVNPQEAVVQDAVAALAREGVQDPAARRERLLPMLRRRREEQNTALQPPGLCLEPAGPFAARRHALRAEPGSMLLAMTDGFYRLSDTYALYTDAGLARACARDGLETLLAELRAHERSGGAGTGLAVKQADDASAVAWRC